jgi:peptide/nickel transport system permease protein
MNSKHENKQALLGKRSSQELKISTGEPGTAQNSRAQAFIDAISQNRLAAVGMVIFLLFFITAVAGVFLTSGTDPVFDPATVRLQEKLQPPLSLPAVDVLRQEEIPPFGRYIFGTDDLGRDVFSRMLQGAWVSLTVGFVAVGISVFVGIFLGGIAGYFGQIAISLGHILAAGLAAAATISLVSGFLLTGLVLAAATALCVWSSMKTVRDDRFPKTRRTISGRGVMTVDTLIMRLVDIMLCFPSFFLILTVVALLPASIYNIMIVIGLTSWMGAARFVRAEFLSLREQDFVTAARALGVHDMRIIFRHIMPNAIAPVLVSATIGIATAILTEAGLSFLGFGVPPPHATWGNILSDGKRFIFDAPWLTFIPGISILIVVLCFNLFGEGLRDAFNPKLKER